MSHELEIIDGKAQMAFCGELPWHGLGTKVSENITPLEMMKVAGLDWEVEKQDLILPNGTAVPGKKALVRATDGQFLDIVGTQWNPVQNKEAFDFFTEFCKAGDMTMNTAGSLFDGKRVWALAKVGTDFSLFNGDKVEGFLLFSNPHEFGKAVDVRFTATRVVCNNTLTMALGKGSDNFVKLSHATEFNPEIVKETLGISRKIMDEYQASAEILGKAKMSDAAFKEFLKKVFGEDKRSGELNRSAKIVYDLLDKQPGTQYAPGTFWQGINAYTYFTDHVQGRSNNARLNNIWYGAGRTKKLKAFETALEMAQA